MRPLAYLTVRRVKNKLLELLRKPLKLIVTLGFVLLLFMNFALSEDLPSGERPLVEFKAIVFAFYLLCFVTEAKKGFQSGGTMFSMADVNLLFMSPLKSVAILLHGVFSRLGSSFFVAFAFIYQFTYLRSFYPIEVPDMLLAVFGYALVVFLSQLFGMLIYFYTCGRAERIKTGKLIFYSFSALFVLGVVIRLLLSGDFSVSALCFTVTSLPMKLFPVAGWVFSAVDALMLSQPHKASLGIVACIIFTVAVFVLLAFSKQGYFEDVLLSAEKNADKKAGENTLPDVKVRRKAGALKGSGASAIFYKHLLENRRTKTSVLSPTSLFYLVLIGVYGLLFDRDFPLLFSLSCMVSFLPVLGGRWLRELDMPHIYMIPESPVKKLFSAIFEMLPKILAESLLQCALIGYLCGLGAFTVLFITLARISVSLVLIASSLLMVRIFREKEKSHIFLAMSVLPGMLFLIPSVFFMVGALNFGLGLIVGFALMSAVNIIVSLILLFLSRNLLKISD